MLYLTPELFCCSPSSEMPQCGATTLCFYEKLTEMVSYLSSKYSPSTEALQILPKSPGICKCYKLKHALYHAIKSTAKILIKCSIHSLPIQKILRQTDNSKGDNTNLKIFVSLLTGVSLLRICMPFLKEILLKEYAPKITEKFSL